MPRSICRYQTPLSRTVVKRIAHQDIHPRPLTTLHWLSRFSSSEQECKRLDSSYLLAIDEGHNTGKYTETQRENQ